MKNARSPLSERPSCNNMQKYLTRRGKPWSKSEIFFFLILINLYTQILYG